MMKNYCRNLLIAIATIIGGVQTGRTQSVELTIASGIREIIGIYDAQVSPDRKTLIVLGGKTIQVYDYETAALLRNIISSGAISRVIYSPDGQSAFITGDDFIQKIDLNSLQVRPDQYPTPYGGLYTAKATGQKELFLGYESVQRFQLDSKTVTTVFNIPEQWGTISNLSVSPDGEKLLLYTFQYKDLSRKNVLINARTGVVIKDLTEPNACFHSFTPTGKIVKISKNENGKALISWIHPTTFTPFAQQIDPTLAFSSVPSYEGGFYFTPGTDEFWASGNQQELRYYTPNAVPTVLPFSGTVSKSKYGSPWSIKSICLVRDRNKAILGTSDNQVVELDLVTGNQTRKFGEDVLSAQYLQASEALKGMVINDMDNHTSVLWSDNGKVRCKPLGNGFALPVISPNGQYIVSANDQSLVIWDRLKDFENPIRRGAGVDVDLLRNSGGRPVGSFSNNGQLIGVVGGRNTMVYGMPDGQVIATIPVKGNYCLFSADAKTILIYFKSPYSDNEGCYLQAWDIVANQKKWQYDFSPKIFHAVLSQQGASCRVYDAFDGKNLDFDINTGMILNQSSGIQRMYGGAFLSKSGLYYSDRGKVYESKNWGEIGGLESEADGFPSSGAFFVQDQHLISPLYTNRILLSDWRSRTLLGRLFLLQAPDEWALVLPDGSFDASPGMMKKIYYTKGRQIIPLDQLSEKFYQPKLLANYLENGMLPNNTPSPIIQSLQPAPRVRIQYREMKRNLTVEEEMKPLVTTERQATIDLHASAEGAKVSEIRLFHNGKIQETITRNLTVADAEDVLDKSVTIQLLPGHNFIRAIAINSQRTESAPAEIDILYTPPQLPITQSDPKSESEASMYVITVGINQYKNPKYNLNYAGADALSFNSTLQQAGTPLFKNIEVVFLADQNATKADILQAFEKIAGKAKSQDVFIFYYAGHGVVATNQMFYLVPHDVTQLYGQDDALAQKGISAGELHQFSQQIHAQKQLFLLDACQSSGALRTAVMRGAAEERAIAQLARSTGTHWLTAAGTEQFASEFAELKHGVFTYCLLEALAGGGDNGDGKITVNEIDSYLQTMVPQISEKYKGAAQYPASYGFGQDFPIGFKKP